MDRLGRALFDACVDLNPHQIEAALFALSSPLSKGVLLADEVSLGKTIEAGLVICQSWAENRRKLLVVCPASFRKQWAEDIEKAAAKEMDDTKRKIADIRRKVRLAPTMQEQAELQAELKKLETLRRRQQQKIFDAEDEIAEKRDSLVEQLTKRMEQKTETETLFTIRWIVK